MSILSLQQIYEYDNDWYCTINGMPVHIASMGGYIPLQFRDTENLRKNQDYVAHLDYNSEVDINDAFIEHETAIGYEYLEEQGVSEMILSLIQDNPNINFMQTWPLRKKLYAYTFIDKARKGFFSYALVDGTTNLFELVASPLTPLKVANNSIHPLSDSDIIVKNSDYRILEFELI